MECKKNTYNKFFAVRNATEKIIDYLFENNTDLWKLLYYTDRQPLFQANLTNTQKADMICKNPAIENATVTKNILFQTHLDEAISVTIPQLRIQIGNISAIDAYRGGFEIWFQIVVPHNLSLIITDYSAVADRSVAIFNELVTSLNGVIIPDTEMKSPLFMNKTAPNGIGRSTGATRDVQSKNYAGYWVCFATLS